MNALVALKLRVSTRLHSERAKGLFEGRSDPREPSMMRFLFPVLLFPTATSQTGAVPLY